MIKQRMVPSRVGREQNNLATEQAAQSRHSRQTKMLSEDRLCRLQIYRRRHIAHRSASRINTPQPDSVLSVVVR